MKNHDKTRVIISPQARIDDMARWAILLSALSVIAYVIWTLNRGFELTDESYYLLLAMHSGSVKFFISAQQWLTAGLWFLSASITTFRFSGMVLLLFSSALLALGVFSAGIRFGLLDNRFKSKALVIAGSIVGAMLYASTINLSPCYNLLASAGAYTAAGLILLASNKSNNLKYVLLVIAGGALGAAALCKLSSGIATGMLLMFWIIFFERTRIAKIGGCVAIFFGTVLFITVVLFVNTSMEEATKAFEQGMLLFRMVQIEPIGSRLVRYAIEYWRYCLTTLGVFFIPIAAMIAYAKTHRVIFAWLGLVVLVVTLLFGSLNGNLPAFALSNVISDGFLFGGFNRYAIQMVAIFAMLVMACIVSMPVWSKNRDTLALFIGLLLLPYSVAIGTGNALFTQAIDSLAPWGTLIAVLMVAYLPKDRSHTLISLIGACFIITITSQIITSSLRPYNMATSLIKQNHVFTDWNLGALKVDVETHQFLTAMQIAVKACGIAPGSPFIGLYDIPGVALALQTIPILTPWLNNEQQATFALDRMTPEALHSVVVALKVGDTGDLPPLPQQLKTFPSGYRFCGMAHFPLIQQKIAIWQIL